MNSILHRRLALFLILCFFSNPLVWAQRPANPGRGPRSVPGVQIKRDLEYVPDGHERHKLDLYLPEKPVADRLPLLVFIHGGGWRNGDKAGGIGHVGRLVASGWFVGASINYRLSEHAQWPAQIHDCKAALRWLRGNAEQYGVDPGKVGVTGTSAGGHLVAMLGTSGDVKSLEGDLGDFDEQSSRVQAVVDYFGPTNFLTMNDFPSRIDHDSPTSPESLLMGGPIQQMKEKVKTASPLTFVSPDDPSFLIIHGTEDPLVPVDQSIQLDQKLEQVKVASVLIQVEQGEHGGFRNPVIKENVSQFWKHQFYGEEFDLADSKVPNSLAN